MSEFVLKYADARGQIKQEIAEATQKEIQVSKKQSALLNYP